MENIIENGKDIMIKIRFLEPTLSKSEKKAAKIIIDFPNEIINMTLAEYAERAGCSEASLIRFCRRLGVSGFPGLKMQLVLYLKNIENKPVFDQEVEREDTMEQILEKVFRYNIRTLEDTLALITEDYDKALKAIANAKSLSFFCIGDAAVPCYLANIKFKRLGINTQVNVDADMQLITAGMLGKDDVAIAISYTGRTKSVVESMRVAKENGATTMCITKLKKSPMIKYCDIKLFTATTDITIGKEIIARRIAEQAILEALYLGIVAKEKPELYENVKITSNLLELNKI